MLLFLLGALVAQAQAQDCPNPEWIANQAEEYLLNFLLEDASDALARTEKALACSDPPPKALLARFFNVEGTLALLQGDTQSAAASFAAAARIDPTQWNDDYGDQARTVYETAAGITPSNGSIGFLPAPREYVVRIDGEEASAPFEVEAGVHLVQIGPADGSALFARRVEVRPGEESSVVTGLSPEALAAAGAGGGAVVVVQTRPVPQIAQQYSAPFSHGESGWTDASQRPVKWSLLMDIARYDTDGKVGARRYRGGKRVLFIGLPLAIVGGYATYVLGWDLFVGRNMERRPAMGIGGAVGVSAGAFVFTGLNAVLGVNGLVKQRKRRTLVVEAADRVVSGQGL